MGTRCRLRPRWGLTSTLGSLLGTYGMGLGSPLGRPPRVWGKRVIFYTPRIAQKWEKQARVQGKTGVFGLWGPQNWPSWLWGGTGNVRLNGPFRQHMKMRVTSTGLQRVVALIKYNTNVV